MLIVLLGWLFAAIVLFAFGTLVLAWLPGRKEELHAVAPVHFLFAGLIAVTALCNGLNYVVPIGAGAVLGTFVPAGLVLAVHRRWLRGYVMHWARALRAQPWPVWAGLAALAAIVLLKSASPSEMYDEGGYYMPYIKWIERYRIIPGLGNIEDRMGFNSAFHMASAFFGLAWLVPGGTYDLNGLLLLAFGAWCLGGAGRLLAPGIPRMSDVMKAFGLFFLMRNMLTSASADLSNILFGEAILILFMEQIEADAVHRPDRRYLLIVLYSLMVPTIKLSSLFVWLVPLYLTLRVLGAGGRIPFGRLALAVVVVLLPWLGRSPILSGYLVYPLHQLDRFAVDWKVPHAVAERQYHYVSEFAKTNARPGESGHLAEHRSLREWVPVWFARENAFNRATAVALGIAMGSLLVFALVHFRWLWRHQRDPLFFGLIVAANVLLWFFRNPSFRFGWAWAIILLAFAFHLALCRLGSGRILRWATLALLAFFFVQNTGKTLSESRRHLAHMLVRPMPVKAVPFQDIDLGALHARLSATNQCWGTAPPCLPVTYDRRLQARGPRVEDGFRIAPR